MSDEAPVCYSKEEIIKVLATLEEIVVSLDRIGSYWFDRESDEEYNEIESKFLTDWDVCRRLAEARHILSEPFPYEAGEDGMDELERRFVILRYWSHPSWKAKP